MTRLWTVGHSTRALDELLELLKAYGIEAVADVRRYPGSRRFPQFNRETLAAGLAAAGIDYRHFPALGGRRAARPDSPNTAWRNESFRGYADYMETQAFREGFEALLEWAGDRPTTILCSEAVWWRCHRSLISDYAKSLGIEVSHLLGPTSSEPHPYTAPARLDHGRLTYRTGEGVPASGKAAPGELFE